MLNKSIIKIRCELQKKNLKKSGKNKFAGFEYFELADFLPTLNELMMSEEINDVFTIADGYATLKLQKDDEENVYQIPFVQFPTPLNKQGMPSMQDIQYLGALNTYYKRYLYLNAFGITDGEIIDAMDQTAAPKKKVEDLPISVEEAQNLEKLIREAPGTTPYEERVESCLKKVGAKDISDLKQSQYAFLVKVLMKK